jgi:hypothetical protein
MTGTEADPTAKGVWLGVRDRSEYVTELRNAVLSRRGQGAGDPAAEVQPQFSAHVTKNGVSAESGYVSPYSLIFWSREG